MEKFDGQLPTIFSAGNPDHFHKNYIVVMDFLSKLEQYVICKEQFHQTKWYQNFIHKWNLPVYYQIRFQEIATPVEEACSNSNFFEPASDAPTTLSIEFHLKVSQVSDGSGLTKKSEFWLFSYPKNPDFGFTVLAETFFSAFDFFNPMFSKEFKLRTKKPKSGFFG